MPRNAVVSGGELVGAARDADLWDFCGARRRPSRAHTVSPLRDFGLWLRGMFHGPACVPGSRGDWAAVAGLISGAPGWGRLLGRWSRRAHPRGGRDAHPRTMA